MWTPHLTLTVDDGIVVVGVGLRRNEIEMRANRAPAALRERLGHEGTIGLYEVFETEAVAWSERVLNLAAERFERRLAEEIARLRVAVVQEIHAGRVEIFKWSFLFWIGQLAATAALLGFMFRVTGR